MTSLANASSEFKPLRIIAIYDYRERNNIHRFHDSVINLIRKFHLIRSVLNKISLNPIISFDHVKLKTNITHIIIKEVFQKFR